MAHRAPLYPSPCPITGLLWICVCSCSSLFRCAKPHKCLMHLFQRNHILKSLHWHFSKTHLSCILRTNKTKHMTSKWYRICIRSLRIDIMQWCMAMDMTYCKRAYFTCNFNTMSDTYVYSGLLLVCSQSHSPQQSVILYKAYCCS